MEKSLLKKLDYSLCFWMRNNLHELPDRLSVLENLVKGGIILSDFLMMHRYKKQRNVVTYESIDYNWCVS